MQLLREKNRQTDSRNSVGHHRFHCCIVRMCRAERSHVAVTRHVSHQPDPQWNTLSERPAPHPSLRLNHNFARRVIQYAHADVIVGQPVFQLFGHLRQHFVRIQGSDRVPRNGIQQRQVPRLGALLLKQSRIFDSNARFAGQHPQQLQVPFVKRFLLIGIHRHRTDGAVICHQRDAAEAPLRPDRVDPKLAHFFNEIVPDQNRLPRANHVFRKEVSRRPGPIWQANAVYDFQVELHFVANRVQRTDIEILHIE